MCHGYGQLARFFIPKFNVLDDGNTFVIAPEAFHRFYLNGFDGKVGASWMTKEDRLSDIHDYLFYLDSLYNEVLKDFSSENFKVNILGFSQGATTVCRWVMNNKVKFDNLILWAGLFPPDMDFNKICHPNKSVKVHLVVGTDDEYLKMENYTAPELVLMNNRIQYQKIVFNGKHVIDSDILIQLKNSL